MSTFRLSITTFLLFFFVSLTIAQDLTGLWQGVSYITGSTRYYVLTMNLQQSGNVATGTAYTKEVNQPRYVIQSVNGLVNNNTFNFADQERLDSGGVFNNWCMRYGILGYEPTLEKLSGIVQTTNCNGSSITMEMFRLKIFADTVTCTQRNVSIRATGQNLRWYKDSTKQMLIYSGDAINPYITTDTTFYVTQTLYNTESPVVPVTIRYRNYTNQPQIVNICEGQSLTVGDTTYRTSGTYTKRFIAINGCDSLITTKLTVKLSPQIQQTFNLCTEQTVTVGDTTYKTSGIYIKKLKTTEGCDSTITTNLTIKNKITFSQTIKLCEGEKVTIGDTIYRTTGQYIKRLIAANGCDSFVMTNLTIKPIQRITRIIRICEGEMVTIGDTTYKTNGVYTKKYTTVNGCDSVIVINILVNPVKQISQDVRICSGRSLTVGDTTYKTEGIYVKKLRTYTGCDSVVTTNLKIVSEVTFVQKLKICEGSSISVGDTTYKTTGVYVKKLRSTEGCDSIVTTDLTIVKFDILISHDTTIRLGDSVRLSASTNLPLSVTWKWTPNISVQCDSCPITWAKPKSNIKYQVEVTDKDSKCRKINSVYIKTNSDCALFAPTAFSPNDDKVNDNWTIYPSNCVKRIKRVAIFNRWGDQILIKSNIPVASTQGIDIWDGIVNGKTIETGIFIYVIEAEYINGESEVIAGDVSILR